MFVVISDTDESVLHLGFRIRHMQAGHVLSKHHKLRYMLQRESELCFSSTNTHTGPDNVEAYQAGAQVRQPQHICFTPYTLTIPPALQILMVTCIQKSQEIFPYLVAAFIHFLNVR